MPEYAAPGVYVEEVPSGVKPIAGVGTSTAGFAGLAERGPLEPTLVESWLDFEMRERSTIEIDGVQAEQIVFFYRAVREDIGHGPGGDPEPTIERALYFDYRGLIWDIRISSNEEVIEEHKVHLEHMLETFQFLP